MAGRETSFLDLPAEIRNDVYLLALSRDEPVLLSESLQGNPTSIMTNYFNHEPGLLAVSRQVREEGSPVFYGINTFQSPYSACTMTFLSQLGFARARMLRNLRALSTHAMLFEISRDTWLYTALMATKRFQRQYDAHLHKDSLLVPFKGHDGLVWKRLTEIAEFAVVGEKYDWDIRWKISEEDKVSPRAVQNERWSS